MARSEKVTIAAVVALAHPPHAQEIRVNDLIFYEGNGCSQDIVFTYNSYVQAKDNCKKHGACKGDNDEARSLRILKSAKRGTQIRLFDDPNGKTDDDYAIINILNPRRFEENGRCVRTFEEELDNAKEGITLDYIRKNGLDGKVSRVQVIPGV